MLLICEILLGITIFLTIIVFYGWFRLRKKRINREMMLKSINQENIHPKINL